MKSWITITIIVLVVAAAVAGAIIFARSTNEPTPVPTNTSTQQQISLYYGNDELNQNDQDCAAVFPVSRTVGTANAVTATVQALVAGPTAAEKSSGYTSQFSTATANAVRSVRVHDGIAYVDLTDIRTIIPNASASCASANLLASVDSTLKQFPNVTSVVMAIQGEPRDFYEWLQLDCPTVSNACETGPFQPTETQ